MSELEMDVTVLMQVETLKVKESIEEKMGKSKTSRVYRGRNLSKGTWKAKLDIRAIRRACSNRAQGKRRELQETGNKKLSSAKERYVSRINKPLSKWWVLFMNHWDIISQSVFLDTQA